MEDPALVFKMMKTTGSLFFGMKPSHNPMRSLVHGDVFILEHLEQKSGTITPGELGAMMRGSSARTAIALRNLEQKGYIEREIDKTDRRKILVSITDEGRKVACEEREEAIGRMNLIVEELGADDSREFIRIAERIVEITGKLKEQEV